MWELDHKEGWAPKNWCFWTVVLEKTLASPLDSIEIKPVSPNGNQPWIFIGRTDAPIFWLPDGKGRLIGKAPDAGKDWRQKGVTEDEMVSLYHRLNGHDIEKTLWDSEGQRSLACCSPRGRRVQHDLVNEQRQQIPEIKHCEHRILKVVPVSLRDAILAPFNRGMDDNQNNQHTPQVTPFTCIPGKPWKPELRKRGNDPSLLFKGLYKWALWYQHFLDSSQRNSTVHKGNSNHI